MLGFHIVQLLFAQTTGIHQVYPRKYLKAALETIVLTIFVTFAFTWTVWSPDQIWDHPAFITLGAFNFCFGWDFAGGNYIGLFMNSFIVYFLWRYTILVNMRIKMQPSPNYIDRVAVRWNNVHAMSGSVFLLIFLVGPVAKYDSPTPLPHGMKELPSWQYHTVCFFFFVIASWVSFVATYLESKHGSIRTTKWYHTYYVIALSIANLFMMGVYIIQGAMFDESKALPKVNGFYNTENCPPMHSVLFAGTEHCSYLSGQWVIVANWAWLITFTAAPYFTPNEPPLTESYLIGEVEDDEEPLTGIQMQ